MSLWKFPNPWDYHGQSAYVVAAETREEAIAILEAEAARTNAEHEAWATRADVLRPRVQSDDRAWAAWRIWLDANPDPDVIDLPDDYAARVQEIGPVYEDRGCDD